LSFLYIFASFIRGFDGYDEVAIRCCVLTNHLKGWVYRQLLRGCGRERERRKRGSLVKDREGKIGLIRGERNRGQMKHSHVHT
jgi:hypothetical protein